jgi:glycine C-acetyltransferase
VFFDGGVVEGTNAVVDLRENFNIFCSIVVYPVVPKGTLMLRLIPTAVHTLDDVEETLDAFSNIRDKLEAGEYKKGEMKNMSVE